MHRTSFGVAGLDAAERFDAAPAVLVRVRRAAAPGLRGAAGPGRRAARPVRRPQAGRRRRAHDGRRPARCSRVADDAPARGRRARAGRRGRRADVHQRALGGHRLVPGPPGAADDAAHRPDRAARPGAVRGAARRAAARPRLDAPRSSRPRRSGWRSGSRCSPWCATARRARRPRHPHRRRARCCAGLRVRPGASRAPGSGSGRTWAPSSPARCSRCSGACRTWWPGRACSTARRARCSRCSWRSGIVAGPLFGEFTARHPLRRSWLVLAVIGATAVAWTVVLAVPPPAPRWLLVLLVVVLALGGPGVDDRLRLRPHVQPRPPAGRRGRHRQRRRVRRVAARRAGRRGGARARRAGRLHAGGVPGGLDGAVRRSGRSRSSACWSRAGGPGGRWRAEGVVVPPLRSVLAARMR